MQTPTSSKKLSIWKIIGIVGLIIVIGFAYLVFSGTDDYNKEADDVTAKATEILGQLKNGQIDEVYKNAHPELIKVTSKGDLSNLLKASPVLTNFTDSKFTKVSHGNGNAELKGELLNSSNTPATFVMVLKQEGEIWKFYTLDIDSNKIDIIKSDSPDANAGKEDKTARITEVNVGEKYNKDKIVENESIISSSSPVIYVSVAATQAVDKIAATVTFVHTETGDTFNSTLPLYKNKEGFFIHTIFEFKKPTNGWPKGTIKVIATLANGDTKETSFESK